MMLFSFVILALVLLLGTAYISSRRRLLCDRYTLSGMRCVLFIAFLCCLFLWNHLSINKDGSLSIVHPSYTFILDISESMKARLGGSGSEIDRSVLQRQYVLGASKSILAVCPSCSINIIVFGGRSFEVLSPTRSLSDISSLLPHITPDIADRTKTGYDGSNFSEAILLSESLSDMRGISQDSRKIIFITDGDNNVGLPIGSLLSSLSTPIDTVGLGSGEGEIFVKNGVVQLDGGGSPIVLSTNHQLLADMARSTGGRVMSDSSYQIDPRFHSKQYSQNSYGGYIIWMCVTVILLISLVSLYQYIAAWSVWRWEFAFCLCGISFFLVHSIFSLVPLSRPISNQGGAVFVVDRNNGRLDALENIRLYRKNNASQEIQIIYRDATEQVLYAGAAGGEGVEKIISEIERLDASESIGLLSSRFDIEPPSKPDSVQDIDRGWVLWMLLMVSVFLLFPHYYFVWVCYLLRSKFEGFSRQFFDA